MMPAKKAAEQQTDFIEVKISIEEAEDLLRWVARTIVTRNANGRKSDKLCALCPRSKLHKESCRHNEVWAVANK